MTRGYANDTSMQIIRRREPCRGNTRLDANLPTFHSKNASLPSDNSPWDCQSNDPLRGSLSELIKPSSINNYERTCFRIFIVVDKKEENRG